MGLYFSEFDSFLVDNTAIYDFTFNFLLIMGSFIMYFIIYFRTD